MTQPKFDEATTLPPQPEIYPTIVSCNASVIKVYNATNVIARFENQKNSPLQKRSILLGTTAAM
jgi:hypothetical protein